MEDEKREEQLLMKGNEAIGEAAIIAGCRHYFGYPITPQSELIEYMAKRLPQVGGTFLQSESEVAAINMVFGAAGAGARVMTSSSSPGISLKQEGISCIAAAELPCVIVNIMRGGPGLGFIQPAQSDYFQATKGGGHGDYHCIVLAPNSVPEMVALTVDAFNLADLYRNPVMILGDGALGQMMEPVSFEKLPVVAVDKPWATSGMGEREIPNTINTVTFSSEELEAVNERLQQKYRAIRQAEARWEQFATDDADVIVVAFGITSRIAYSAVEQAREAGLKVGLFRPISLWPFPGIALAEAAKRAKAVLTVELSAGQMVEDVELAIRCSKPVYFQGRMGGIMMTPKDIYEQVVEILKTERSR